MTSQRAGLVTVQYGGGRGFVSFGPIFLDVLVDDRFVH